jgi:AcrR family transcriptional regulator
MPTRRTAPLSTARRTQEERRAETQAKLIAAAIDLICRHGYANLTTPEIATQAGVSRGALQHHFKTRYDLITAVNDKLTTDMLALGETFDAAKLSLRLRVEKIIAHYWTVYTSPAYLAILNISLGIQDDETMRRRVRRLLVDIYRRSDGPWLALFGDVGQSEATLLACRRWVLATLRGLALARWLGIQRQPAQQEIAFLKAALLERLERGEGRAAAESAA